MAEGDSKRETDPAKLAQLLEIELMQKRAQWQSAKARRRNIRALSFAFLFLVIAGALAAFFFFFSSTERPLRPAGDATNSPAAARP